MKVDSDRNESYDFRLALGLLPAGPKTSSLPSCIGIAVTSPKFPEDWVAACGPENNGAGGKGRFGFPPYFDDGVPGRGLPLISAGSYGISDGGGLDDSDEVRESVDREGEVRLGMYGKYDDAFPVVGVSFGAVSTTEGECGRDIEEVEDAEVCFDRRGETGLAISGNEL